MSRKHPTLVDCFRRWPELLVAFSSLAEDGQHRIPWTKAQVEQCLEWAIGEDWKDVRLDRIPERIMLRLNLPIPMDEDPLVTFQRVADKWWTYRWALETSTPGA